MGRQTQLDKASTGAEDNREPSNSLIIYAVVVNSNRRYFKSIHGSRI